MGKGIEGKARRDAIKNLKPDYYCVTIQIKDCCCGEHTDSFFVFKHENLGKCKEYFEKFCNLKECRIIGDALVVLTGKRIYNCHGVCVGLDWIE